MPGAAGNKPENKPTEKFGTTQSSLKTLFFSVFSCQSTSSKFFSRGVVDASPYPDFETDSSL